MFIRCKKSCLRWLKICLFSLKNVCEILCLFSSAIHSEMDEKKTLSLNDIDRLYWYQQLQIPVTRWIIVKFNKLKKNAAHGLCLKVDTVIIRKCQISENKVFDQFFIRNIASQNIWQHYIHRHIDDISESAFLHVYKYVGIPPRDICGKQSKRY